MPANTLEVKQHAHELLEQLGPGQLAAVVNLLEVMIHEDEEELTEEDRRAVSASREYFRQNPEGGISFENLAAECGFTMDQIRNQGNWRLKKIRFHANVAAEVRAIEQKTALRILQALHRYAETGQGRVKPPRGEFEGLLRLRVGNHRVFFDETEDTITVHRVRDRKEVYRDWWVKQIYIFHLSELFARTRQQPT